jgi:hypothetical protein
MDEPRSDVQARFRALLELHDLSVALMRQNLRRSHPEAADEEIERLLQRWLAKRDEGEASPWTHRVESREQHSLPRKRE